MGAWIWQCTQALEIHGSKKMQVLLEQTRQIRWVETCQAWVRVIYLRRRFEMNRNIYTALLGLLMIAVIVGMDLLFFRNLPWQRLFANIGVVLVFLAIYWRFLRKP